MPTLTASDKSHLITNLQLLSEAQATQDPGHRLIPFVLVGDCYYTIGWSAYYIAATWNVEPTYEVFTIPETGKEKALPVIGVQKSIMGTMAPRLSLVPPVAVIFNRSEMPDVDLNVVYAASGEPVVAEAHQA